MPTTLQPVASTMPAPITAPTTRMTMPQHRTAYHRRARDQSVWMRLPLSPALWAVRLLYVLLILGGGIPSVIRVVTVPRLAKPDRRSGTVVLWPSSRRLHLSSDLSRHRFGLAERGSERGLLRKVGHSSKFALVLLGYEPEMEVGCPLHHCQVVDTLNSCSRFDRWNKLTEKKTEIGTFGRRHFAEIQQVPSRFDNERSGVGLL